MKGVITDQDGIVPTIQFLSEFLSLVDFEKDQIEIQAKRVEGGRTGKQNAALFGCAYKYLSEETGNDPDDLHLYFCGEYFGWVVRKVMGQDRRAPKRTTTKNEEGHRDVITTSDCAKFYQFIQDRCATTIGLSVPDPDPSWKQRMREAKT